MLLNILFSSSTGDKLMAIIPAIIATLVIVIVIMPIHELSHALVAKALGDDTAKRQGRLTINPLASIDPMGALFILLFGFGWAKPVPINPNNFRHPRVGMALTALAGPLSNLLVSLLAALGYVGLVVGTKGGIYSNDIICDCFINFISINVSLAVFNLVPLPPLDGSKILGSFLPDKVRMQYFRYQYFIMLGVMVLLISGILGRPLYYAENACFNGIFWLAKLPFQLAGVLA